jgi:hypothetical protein
LEGQQAITNGQLELQAGQVDMQQQMADAVHSNRRRHNELMQALAKLEVTPKPAHPSASSSSPSSHASAVGVLHIDLTDLQIDAEPVGSGGFGDVHHGAWISRDLDVAVKRLRVNSLSKNTLAEFQAEVALLAGVPRHDHVVGLFGICVDPVQHVYMMVLEWMERSSLYDFIRQTNVPDATPLSLLDRLRLILQCVKAVNHLHLLQRPIVHGDAESISSSTHMGM